VGQRPTPEIPDAKREKPLVRVSILAVASSPIAPIVYPDPHCSYDLHCRRATWHSYERGNTSSVSLVYSTTLSWSLSLSLRLFLFPSFPPGRPDGLTVSRPRATFQIDRKWSTLWSDIDRCVECKASTTATVREEEDRRFVRLNWSREFRIRLWKMILMFGFSRGAQVAPWFCSLKKIH